MKNLTIKALCLFSLSILTTTISAKNYYAAPTGTSGAAGTLAAPLDIETAIKKSDWDTIFLRGGQYNLKNTLKPSKIGSATARKAIFAYQDEKPVLDFREQDYSKRGVEFSGSYLHVKGITICYTGKNGFYNTSNYSIFENCVTYGNGDTGFQLKSCHGNLIKNCDSYDNFDYKLGDVYAADYGGNADGFTDKQYTDTGDPNIYEGCRSWNNSDDGWDFFDRYGNTQLKNSICYKNGPASYDMTTHPRYNTDIAWFSQFPRYVTDADGNTVYVTLSNYTNFGNGNGFKLGGNYSTHNVTVTNCLSAQNTVKGFDQNNNNGSMTLYNNTAYNNGTDYGFNNASYGSLVIKNCVSLSSKSSNKLSAKSVTNLNNSWNTSGVTCNAADFISTEASQILTTRKADGSLADITFMHLVAGSDLIDKGIAVGLPYSGSAPDLGCYEYGNDIHYPPTVSTPNNMNQNVTENTPIENIVFTWGGSATGLTVSTLPNNLNYSINESAKTLTVYGTPTTMGVYSYTVTTVGGVGDAMEITGTIVASSANAKNIAYVTIPNSDADTPILAKLNNNLEFKTTIIDAEISGTDYSSYDLVIVSPQPGSDKAGMGPIEFVDKPRLILKPFIFKNTVWNWGTAVNTSQATITVTNKSHEIFANLTFTGTNNDELVLFSAVTTNAVTGITSWVGTPAINQLAVAKGITPTTQSIVEIPVGTTMNGTPVNSRFLMIGLSEYSTANLTESATQLIENSCYYLMSMTIPSKIWQPNTSNNNYKLVRQGNDLVVIGGESNISKIKLISVSGSIINTAQNTNRINVSNIPTGVYLLQLQDENNRVNTLKFIKSF
jgi:hypothetical protein